jgi:ABC-type multidrug transport system ATPase subunit
MGSSGAGKTTLLNVLSDRVRVNKHARLTGSIMVNDSVKLNQDLFGSVAGYVM